MTEDELAYVLNWTNRFGVGEKFTFQLWKQAHKDDQNAPASTVIGRKVVASLKADPPDARLHFIGLTEGPAVGEEVGPKTGNNAQWYLKIE
jgi:hypothetical protein